MGNSSLTRRAARWLGPWWGVVLVLLGVSIGVSAGLWQLNRAAYKQELETRFAAGGAAGALPLLVADEKSGQARYRMIRVTGRYDAKRQVLLDNISSQGRPGYQVLTPFSTGEGTVLVNRGWLPADGDRRVLPDIRVGEQPREVLGRIEQLPQPGITLPTAPPAATAAWPRRLLFPTTGEVSAQLNTPLRSYQLLLDPSAPDGYQRAWQPGGMGPDRHRAYALQWFGLALTVFIIYLVLVFRNGKQAP